MDRGLYITTANLSESGGGDVVSLHESNALSKFCDVIDIYTPDDIDNSVKPYPFMWDFTLSMKIDKRYDIVHINGHPFFKTIGTLKYYNPDIKVITTVPAHNLEQSIEEHHKLGINYEELYPHMIGDKFYEYVAQDRVADTVVFPSKLAMDYFVKRVGLTNDYVIIPHGCDTPLKYPSYPANPAYAYIGALGPDKGVNYLLKAFSKRLHDHLDIYGKYSEGVKVDMDNVKVHGRYDNLESIMPDISIGVFPSATEGFNIPALECMAWGRPIIISDGAGFAEYVTDEVNGFVVPRCNPDAIVEKIQYFMDNSDEVSKMGEKAHNFSKLLQWDDVEREYLKVYRKLIL